jgi:hypothetical protein
MSDDVSGVSRSSWIAIPQAMQQHGQAKRAIESRVLPSKETAPGDKVATATTERSEPKLP